MTPRVRLSMQIVLTMLLALVVALRVVAHPMVLSAPGPGLVALCSNGKIIYVSLETGLPVESDTEEGSQSCPYAGMSALAEHGGLHQLLRVIDADRTDHLWATAQIDTHRSARAHTPRAPPFFI